MGRRGAAGSRGKPTLESTAMGKLIKTLTGKSRKAARKAYKAVETRVLVAEGKKAVRGKVSTVKKVTRKAIKTGLITGALAAASVVAREIRKRRKTD
jgi:hypothetical protein